MSNGPFNGNGSPVRNHSDQWK